MPCLLDVEHCVHLLMRSPQVVPRAPIHECRVSAVTAGELYAGVHHLVDSKRSRNHAAVLDFLGAVAVLALDEQVARVYAGLCAGTGWALRDLGAHDLWVLAHALALDVPLITSTPHRFARIPGLDTDNWVQADAAH